MRERLGIPIPFTSKRILSEEDLAILHTEAVMNERARVQQEAGRERINLISETSRVEEGKGRPRITKFIK